MRAGCVLHGAIHSNGSARPVALRGWPEADARWLRSAWRYSLQGSRGPGARERRLAERRVVALRHERLAAEGHDDLAALVRHARLHGAPAAVAPLRAGGPG